MDDKEKKELFQKAITLHQDGNFHEADKIYMAVLSTDKNNFAANYLHGCILLDRDQLEESIKYLELAVKLQPDNFEVNNTLGIAFKNLGNLSDSAKHFRKSILIDDKNYQAYFNCANVYADMLDFKSAKKYFELTLMHNKNFAEAKQRLGEVYQEMFKVDRNKEHLSKAISYFDSIFEDGLSFTVSSFHTSNTLISLGLSYLWLENIDKANEYFKKLNIQNNNDESYSKKYIEEHLSNKESMKTIITHEFEQLTHIDEDIDEIRNPKFTKEYYHELKKLYYKIKDNSFSESDVSNDTKIQMTKILYNKAPKIKSENLINEENDVSKLESQYLEKSPEVLVIDNFLTSEALHEIQKFCRNANIFKYPYTNGYVGAFLTKGLSNKFILKLSEDLRYTYSKIFKEMRLSQAWIYKYDSTKKGINIHADPAGINVNFWVTPNEGNLNPNNGGLKVWNKFPPKEWDFDEYNTDVEKMKKFLSENKSKELTIPYKENRAVIFNSKLFHSTDTFTFNDSYIHKRINITFLYE
tara:strand:- start:253 stop:1827 length:1575 start_codon:yes stop_codon:yes gene_type:complete